MNIPHPIVDGAVDCCPACGAELLAEVLDTAGDTCCPHCQHFLWFLSRCSHGMTVLTFLPGLMSGSEAMDRVQEVYQAVTPASRVILNLSRMRLVSSMFLGMLVALQKRVAAAKGTLKLCGLNSETRDVFRLSKLDWVFDIYEDEEAARDSFD